jgi:hypothetical protein
MNTRLPISLVYGAVLTCVSGIAVAQPVLGDKAEKLGAVDFPVSCNAEAQRHMTRGVALYHSFHWPEARKSFNAVAQADSSCAMAHWGLAMVAANNPYVWPLTGKALVEGAASVKMAKALGATTPRERDYINALESFYLDADRIPARTRQLNFELALEKMTRDYPQDAEARVIYGMVLAANVDPNDKTYSNQARAADVLERVQRELPDHPGAPHYLIHTYDYPPLAQRGLPAAQRYRDVAPSAFHALHMPSHIFTRLGYWQDSVASNVAVLKTPDTPQSSILHSYDYMAYAWLQLGQDRSAKKVLADMLAMPAIKDTAFAAAFALAAIPARAAVERGRWSDAARLQAFPDELDYPWASFPHAEAIRVFARGLGSARSRNPAAARRELVRLEKLKADMLNAKLFYWADQAEIQIKAVEAWTLRAEGQPDAALALMRDAADHEDRTDKSAVTPGPIKPARELLAEMLMESKRPVQALAEFESVLAKEPRRLQALLGAARAAESSKDQAKARVHYAALAKLLDGADAERTELRQAKAYLARK